jgi:Flp pilus assembly protein TadG
MKLLPFRRKKNSQRGAAQVEFILSILVMIFVMFWLFEMGMLVYTYTVIAASAKEGVRYAIVHGSKSGSPNGPGNDAAVKSAALEYAKLSLHDVSAITITPNYPDENSVTGDPGNNPQERVVVTVSYQYIPYIKLPFFSPDITATSQGRIVF